jgi:hypothetical protein
LSAWLAFPFSLLGRMGYFWSNDTPPGVPSAEPIAALGVPDLGLTPGGVQGNFEARRSICLGATWLVVVPFLIGQSAWH